MRVAVIGGGAAGFFAAINVKENYPNAHVDLLEKSNKLLTKVKISGGGRCNVTNVETSISKLAKAYPRGEKALKKAFKVFATQDTIKWFKNKNVSLYAQEDGRMFPRSNDSQTIVDCLYNNALKKGVKIHLKHAVSALKNKDKAWTIKVKGQNLSKTYDKVIIATGGASKLAAYEWLQNLGHPIRTPIPSLFTFNVPNDPIRQLMGLSVPSVKASIVGEKATQEGAILMTHWGLSGPAILKLSAFAAELLHEKNYHFQVAINWINLKNHEEVYHELTQIKEQHPKKQISNTSLFGLPKRLLGFLLEKSEIPQEKPFGEIGKKQLNKLIHTMTNDIFSVKGKTTFKEEFVTCGGIEMSAIDINSMQSKICPNLYFAGEVLNIDAVTGGYNFQAAWTTAFIAGKLLD